jgi:hypothetical protein
MKEIILANNRGTALVDGEDFEYLMHFNWYLDATGYVCRGQFNTDSGTHSNIKMHRSVLGLTKEDKVDVDHLDGNRLNNQKENLRKVNRIINMQNIHNKRKNKSSKYIGVSYTKDEKYARLKRWAAAIVVNKKLIHLGRFLTENEAALAYNGAAQKFGFLTRNIIV